MHWGQLVWKLGHMVKFTYTCRRQGKINVRTTTGIQKNTGVIISSIGANELVRNNKEIQTPPHNSKVHHIGCIYILQVVSSGRPDLRRIGS